MGESKFKKGELVLYQNGSKFELGVVKEVVSLGSHEENKIAYGYRVWYHMGETTALTDETLLHKIQNAYAFTVLRRSVEPDIALDPCKQMAEKLMRAIDEVVRENYGSENNLWVTEEESDLTEEIPGMISGSYDEVLELYTKILKEEI